MAAELHLRMLDAQSIALPGRDHRRDLEQESIVVMDVDPLRDHRLALSRIVPQGLVNAVQHNGASRQEGGTASHAASESTEKTWDGQYSSRQSKRARTARPDATVPPCRREASSVVVLTTVKANQPRNYWSGDQLSTCGQDIMLRR